MHIKKFLLGGALLLAMQPLPSNADSNEQLLLKQLSEQVAAMNKTIRGLQETVELQQKKIAGLERVNQTVSQNPPASAVPVPSSAKAPAPFIPDIGVVGDIVASSTENKEEEEGNDRLSVRELELVFGHDIDPYARLDAVITFSDQEDPDIEEAYATYWDLPYELKGKIGRMRQKVGKASAQHRDTLDTVDEPLVIQEYLGVEGLFRTGVELNGFTPLSGDSFTQQLAVGVMEGGVGEDGALFGESRRRPSFYAHLGNFIDISDTSNAELGGTYLVGSKDDDGAYEVNAFGIDATLVHYVTPLNKLKWQNEVYLQDRDESFRQEDDGSLTEFDDHPWGAYSLLDYRLNERFGIGTRLDYVEPIDREPESAQRADRAISAYFSYYQSEFARWRLQYQNADLTDGSNDNRLYLQGTFAIGTHKHQLQ